MAFGSPDMLDLLHSWDVKALAVARGWIDPAAGWFPALKIAVSVLADAEVFLFALALVGLWLYGRFKAGHDAPKREALRCFWLSILALLTYWALNFFLPVRARPETVSSIPPLVAHLPDNCFPSGHALFWIASVVALASFSRCWMAGIATVLGMLMCTARVVAGIHFPGDILVGAGMGLFIALAYRPVVRAEWFDRAFVTPFVELASIIGL